MSQHQAQIVMSFRRFLGARLVQNETFKRLFVVLRVLAMNSFRVFFSFVNLSENGFVKHWPLIMLTLTLKLRGSV